MEKYRVTPAFIVIELEGKEFKVEELTLEQHDELGDLQESYNEQRQTNGWGVKNEAEAMLKMCKLLAPVIPDELIVQLRPRSLAALTLKLTEWHSGGGDEGNVPSG